MGPGHGASREEAMSRHFMTDRDSNDREEDVIFCTSYCNRGHKLKTGVPVEHECYVLPPRALKLEREEKYAEAIKAIEARPLRRHSGIKE